MKTEQIEKYIEFDPFLDCDRDVEVKHRVVKIVKTRGVHYCMTPCFGDHLIPAGSLARCERAFVCRSPGQYYTCLPCLDHMIDVIEKERDN